MRQLQDLQDALFSLSNCSAGVPLTWTGRGAKIAANSKMPNKYISYSPSEGHVTSNYSLLLPSHTWSALADLCVAQNAHPVNFPLTTSDEDNNSNKALSSRGCSQNHQGRWLGEGFQCVVVHSAAGFELKPTGG